MSNVIEFLADHAERKRIADHFDNTLFVEAGAGTGKTSSLVTRVRNLVLTGEVELQQIAAITFTEAAAAELRDRVRIAFEESVAASDPASVEHQRALRALEQIDIAAIQTLHGFAYRILSLYPLEAGLPPRLEVRDDVRARIAFADRWNELLDELLEREDPSLPLLAALEQGLTLRHLRDLARELHAEYGSLPTQPLPQPLIQLPLAEVRAALEACLEFEGCCSDPADKLLPTLSKVLEAQARLCMQLDVREQSAILEGLTKLSTKNGRKGNWPDVEAARAALAEVTAKATEALQLYRRALLVPLVDRLRRWVLDYAAERRAEGILEFQDLLVLARELLRDNADVRRALRDRYRRLLIDEFQDTDPIQLEIAALLATPLDDLQDRNWDELPIEQGRLFFVGDPKQAIYHFRGADITLYSRARDVFGAESVNLRQNFRTVPAVINWVNSVFSYIIGQGKEEVQAPYVELHPHRSGEGLPVYVLGGRSEAKLDDLRQAEAREIVGAIQQVKREGWTVFDKDGRPRPARYEDITILLPARTTLPWLERVLDEMQVPYRVESRTLLYGTQEVRDLTNLLAAIDDPTDQVSLVAALRSPAFACGDDDLYEWRQAGGRWDFRRTAAPASLDPSHPVAAAMTALRELHEERWSRPLNELVEHVIRERKLFELAYAFRRPRERWQRLRFVADQARVFAGNQQATLREFVRWLREQAKEDVRVVDTVVPHADDDAVRIMTIHAAKGLEFPVVVMAGLNAGRNTKRPILLWSQDGQPQVALAAQQRFTTEKYAECYAFEEEHQRHEKVRLLYVAATRARDHLIVSLHHPAGHRGSDTHARVMWEPCGFNAHQNLWQQLEPADPTPEPPAPQQDEPPLQSEAEWQAERDALLAGASHARSLAATAIAQAAEPDGEPSEAQPWRRGRAGTNVGRAVHATLQSVNLADASDLEQVAAAQAEAEGVGHRIAEVVALSRAALAAPAIREALARRYWREVYVGAEVEGTVVEGFIDLLYESEDGLVVVDYKTDTVPDDSAVDAAFARYRLQGAAYVLALRELAEQIGLPVVRCVFVFLRGAEPRERTLEGEALESALTEVLQVLARG